MATRLELQAVLENIVKPVYFQPPSTLTMKYPCIVYERDSSRSEYADNDRYTHTKRYQVTIIDRNPDSELPDKVEALPYCSFERSFVTESLRHTVFNLFF